MELVSVVAGETSGGRVLVAGGATGGAGVAGEYRSVEVVAAGAGGAIGGAGATVAVEQTTEAGS